MTAQQPLSDIRREYGSRTLSEEQMPKDPIEQFKRWFDEIIAEEIEPTAMTLATVDPTGMPNARIVLLKGTDEGKFAFYTDYESAKGREITHSPQVALNFFWAKYSRQVRIRGTIEKISSEISDAYFASRPLSSQISAVASEQSTTLVCRKVLEERVDALSHYFVDGIPVPRPEHWGGYAVLPVEIEFWQGRDNRLHDRIRYVKHNSIWTIERLSP